MAKQLLHLVFGGELTALDKVDFRDLERVHFVGLYPNFAKAKEAWKAAAQSTVDNAHMRYFVVHLHKLLQPGVRLDAPNVKPAGKKTAAKKLETTRQKARKAPSRK